MADEWGPWVEHDGKGCPVKGQWVHAFYRKTPPLHLQQAVGGFLPDGSFMFVAGPGESWDWAPGWCHIVRYRVRRPRALLDLIEMVETLPAPSEPVPA